MSSLRSSRGDAGRSPSLASAVDRFGAAGLALLSDGLSADEIVRACAPAVVTPRETELAVLAALGFGPAAARRVLALRERLLELRRQGVQPAAAVTRLRVLLETVRTKRSRGGDGSEGTEPPLKRAAWQEHDDGEERQAVEQQQQQLEEGRVQQQQQQQVHSPSQAGSYGAAEDGVHGNDGSAHPAGSILASFMQQLGLSVIANEDDDSDSDDDDDDDDPNDGAEMQVDWPPELTFEGGDAGGGEGENLDEDEDDPDGAFQGAETEPKRFRIG